MVSANCNNPHITRSRRLLCGKKVKKTHNPYVLPYFKAVTFHDCYFLLRPCCRSTLTETSRLKCILNGININYILTFVATILLTMVLSDYFYLTVELLCFGVRSHYPLLKYLNFTATFPKIVISHQTKTKKFDLFRKILNKIISYIYFCNN